MRRQVLRRNVCNPVDVQQTTLHVNFVLPEGPGEGASRLPLMPIAAAAAAAAAPSLIFYRSSSVAVPFSWFVVVKPLRHHRIPPLIYAHPSLTLIVVPHKSRVYDLLFSGFCVKQKAFFASCHRPSEFSQCDQSRSRPNAFRLSNEARTRSIVVFVLLYSLTSESNQSAFNCFNLVSAIQCFCCIKLPYVYAVVDPC